MYIVNEFVLNFFPELSDIPIQYFFGITEYFTIQKQIIRKIAQSP